MKRRISPIVIALCTVILGAGASYARGFNAIGQFDNSKLPFNAFGFGDAVPELQGVGGVALLTVIGSVAYGARRIYQKIARRGRE